jgi:perosamine synthetase
MHRVEGGMDFVCAGMNYRMTDLQAAIGTPQLLRVDPIIKHRVRTAAFYDEKLGTLSAATLPVCFKNRGMVYQAYHILLKEGINRNALIASLKESGIETTIGAYAIQCLSYYRTKYGLKEGDFPNALIAYRHGLALPIGDHVKRVEASFIASTLLDLLRPYT